MASSETKRDEKSGEWEILDIPPLIDFGVKQKAEKDLLGPADMEASHKKEKDRLCGYLWKQGAKGLLKSWKHRWFVYDHRRCLLYYYRKPQDGEPLGNIDIANATFGFSAEDKALFQISSNDRTYHIQAKDRNTMMFWLQELQARRREYGSHEPATTDLANNGLLCKQGIVKKNDDNISVGMNEPVEKPVTIGDSAASTQGGNLNSWNFSFTNLNKEFKNWRKSAFLTPTGEIYPNGGNSSSMFYSYSEDEQQTQEIKVTEQKQYENKRNKSVDFGFTKLVANIKKKNPPTISRPVSQQDDIACLECKENFEMVNVLREAICVAEKEMKTRDDVIESLSEQLRIAAMNRGTDSRSPEEKAFEEKEDYITQLKRMVQRLNKELTEVTILLKEKEVKLEEKLGQEKVLKEMIQAKDNSIIVLTNKVFSLEQAETGEDVCEEIEATDLTSGSSNSQEVMNYYQLKETCTAYQSQNNFLNSEILELNKLRRMDTERLKIVTEKFEHTEAELLKLKSRYLYLLKEFSTPQREGGNGSADMVEQLIDDAIKENPEQDMSKENRYSDKYGFYDMYDGADGERLENLADRCSVLLDDKENISLEVSVGVKWENLLVAQGNTPFTKTEELKFLIRNGVPHEFRARVWKDMIDLRINREREMAGTGYYLKLLKEKKGVYTPSSKQIELDLLRTLPNNKYYDRIESEGTAKLRRILLAYSWHNPAVGYCQGLNRLGAIALLYLDEESAFWCLVAIVEHLMPLDYYSRTLLGAQVDQKVCKDLIDEKFPKLGTHLQSMKLDMSLISFNWFLTVFVDFFPIELTLRVWDTFLFEGSKVLFRYALAVFKTFEDDLLKIGDPGRLFNYFRQLSKSRFNIQKIYQIAFIQVNPFSRRNVESKRRYYRPLLQAQLDEFEVLRQEYRDKRADSDVLADTPLSDDDDN
ncbi:TBC1 domain family member 2B-like isoform X1 [Hydractinia symbiolongicarpus]|uniref:TBC1 domain family member 2B-like isoform X1 n=1 Tax=Hydractinia symbiolongicarpus TaxID=13093 RepID=UPI00254FE6FD|nr:TBC1 domain family member 2B-like isoform X1 [Hydractinia symbiolongicarpus]